ncbi:MAG: hypothetical protein V9E81_05720 [Marmoricola sp.]
MSVIRQLRTRIWGRQLFGFPPPPAGHMAAVVSLFPRGLTELEAISVVGYLRGLGQAPSDSDIAEALMKFTHQLPSTRRRGPHRSVDGAALRGSDLRLVAISPLAL